MGEAAVRADLDFTRTTFASPQQQFAAWEWIHGQRMKREAATEKALRRTASWTLVVALATFLVAAFTAALVLVELFRSREGGQMARGTDAVAVGRYVPIADQKQGIWRIDTTTGKVSFCESPDSATKYGLVCFGTTEGP